MDVFTNINFTKSVYRYCKALKADRCFKSHEYRDIHQFQFVFRFSAMQCDLVRDSNDLKFINAVPQRKGMEVLHISKRWRESKIIEYHEKCVLFLKGKVQIGTTLVFCNVRSFQSSSLKEIDYKTNPRKFHHNRRYFLFRR